MPPAALGAGGTYALAAPSRTTVVAAAKAPLNVGQNVLFLVVAAAMDIAYHELKAKGREASPAEVSAAIAEATQQIVNSGAMWSGLTAAGGAHMLLKKPLAILNQTLSTAQGKKLLSAMIKSTVATGVVFLSWEFGSQLWTEAAALVKNPEDRERLSLLASVGWNGARAMFTQNPKDLRDLGLLLQMGENMVHVLANDKARSAWFDRTWRTRVMTGDFQMMMGAMIAAGTFGSIFPGAGTFAGAMFGLSAAAVVIVTPAWVKDRITLALGEWREGRAKGFMASNEMYFKAISPNTGYSPNTNFYKQLLSERRVLRNQHNTILFERINLAVKRLLPKEDRTPEQVTDSTVLLRAAFQAMYDLYKGEKDILNGFLTKPGLVLSQEIQNVLKKHVEEIQSIESFLLSIDSSLSGIIAAPEALDSALVESRPLFDYVEQVYLNGFDEQALLD